MKNLSGYGAVATLILLAFMQVCCSRRMQHAEELSITTRTLATLIRARVPMTILDARTGAHDDGRRIPGAVAMAPDATPEELSRAAPSKDGLVVVYCRDPECPNFARLAARMRELGYANVLEYPEGIEGWAKAGLDTTKAGGRR